MNNCQFCGCQRKPADKKCPECGSFYPTISQLLAEEEAYEEKSTFLWHCKQVIKSGNSKQALIQHLQQFKSELTLKGIIAIFVIIAFVFALLLSVL
jgi:uncharacterized membrane protein YvbJ